MYTTAELLFVGILFFLLGCLMTTGRNMDRMNKLEARIRLYEMKITRLIEEYKEV